MKQIFWADVKAPTAVTTARDGMGISNSALWALIHLYEFTRCWHNRGYSKLRRSWSSAESWHRKTALNGKHQEVKDGSKYVPNWAGKASRFILAEIKVKPTSPTASETHGELLRSVVPYWSIDPIGQLAHFFCAVRQYLPVDQLVRHW
jgi:hypothetical protein